LLFTDLDWMQETKKNHHDFVLKVKEPDVGVLGIQNTLSAIYSSDLRQR